MSKYRLNSQKEQQRFRSAVLTSLATNDLPKVLKQMKSLYKNDQLAVFNFLSRLPSPEHDEALAGVLDVLDGKIKKPHGLDNPPRSVFRDLVARVCALSVKTLPNTGTVLLVKKVWPFLSSWEQDRVAFWYLSTPSPLPNTLPQSCITKAVTVILDRYEVTGDLFSRIDPLDLHVLDNAFSMSDPTLWQDFQQKSPKWVEFFKNEPRTPRIQNLIVRSDIQKEIASSTPSKSASTKKM